MRLWLEPAHSFSSLCVISLDADANLSKVWVPSVQVIRLIDNRCSSKHVCFFFHSFLSQNLVFFPQPARGRKEGKEREREKKKGRKREEREKEEKRRRRRKREEERKKERKEKKKKKEEKERM